MAEKSRRTPEQDIAACRAFALQTRDSGVGVSRTLDDAADQIERMDARNEALEKALKPFAECADQIGDSESDEEWAKFRLLVKDYRLASTLLKKASSNV